MVPIIRHDSHHFLFQEGGGGYSGRHGFSVSVTPRRISGFGMSRPLVPCLHGGTWCEYPAAKPGGEALRARYRGGVIPPSGPICGG